MSLQRDFVFMFSYYLILCVYQLDETKCLGIILAGISLGAAFIIKPQFGIGLPVIFLMSYEKLNLDLLKNYKRWIIDGIVLSLAFVTPTIISFLWVQQTGGWEEFWFLQKNYLPLYVELNKEHVFVESGRSIFS